MSLRDKLAMKQVRKELTKSKNYVQATLKKYKKITNEAEKIADNKQVKQLLTKIDKLKPVAVDCDVKRSKQIKQLTRMTTAFSAVVIVGLTIGLTALATQSITPENFDAKMTHSIETGVGNEVTQGTVNNGNISYYLPKQFQYRYSLGVNDIIRFKDKQLIMHYNEEYNVIGQDVETYYLLRDENKLVGEEVYYQNFNENENNGFVQLVQLSEDYLLTVFINGAKLSTILRYEETPYMTYNMLMIGKSITEYTPIYEKIEPQEQEVTTESDDEPTDEVAPKQPAQIPPTDEAEAETLDGELSSDEEEETLEFDFSTEARESEVIEGEE